MSRIPHLLAAALVATACAPRTAPMASPRQAAAAQAPAPAPKPAPLRYSPGTGHYRLETQSHIQQEVMGQTTNVDISTAVLLTTVAAADSSGNLGVGITIDSLAVTLPPNVPAPDPADLAAARGKTTRLVTSPQGQSISLTPPDGVTGFVQQVTQGFRDFLPQLPAGSPDSGATWSDTTSMSTGQAGTATVRTARVHRVLGWEDHSGTRALHLTTTATYTVSGTSEAQGQTIELSGGGARTWDSFISAAGVYLGGTVSDSSLVNANITSAGMVVPVHSTTRSSLTRLP